MQKQNISQCISEHTMNRGTETDDIAIPAVSNSTNDNAVHNAPIATIININESEINKSKQRFSKYSIYLKT